MDSAGSADTSLRESPRDATALAGRDAARPVMGLPPTGGVARPDDIARLALFCASVCPITSPGRCGTSTALRDALT